jgi:hypothetical protein
MPGIPNITAENAVEMQRRSTASKLAEKALIADPAAKQKIAEKFQEQRLVRVRKQLETMDGLIDKEMSGDCDAGRLDRLANAAIRLNEQERQLSNRSLPPTLKASQPRTKRSASADPEPE